MRSSAGGRLTLNVSPARSVDFAPVFWAVKQISTGVVRPAARLDGERLA